MHGKGAKNIYIDENAQYALLWMYAANKYYIQKSKKKWRNNIVFSSKQTKSEENGKEMKTQFLYLIQWKYKVIIDISLPLICNRNFVIFSHTKWFSFTDKINI